MKIVKEEIFGPVGVVIKFKDEASILDIANDTDYGLSACIYTKDINRATKMATSLEAGSIYVSSPR
jgi:aldehyde dehydrogenase (NAD+)